jgi:hypothetical protein
MTQLEKERTAAKDGKVVYTAKTKATRGNIDVAINLV